MTAAIASGAISGVGGAPASRSAGGARAPVPSIAAFGRVNYGTLEVQITVDDPKAYSKPWTVTLTQRLMPDDDLIEFVCEGNEKSSARCGSCA